MFKITIAIFEKNNNPNRSFPNPGDNNPRVDTQSRGNAPRSVVPIRNNPSIKINPKKLALSGHKTTADTIGRYSSVEYSTRFIM